MSKMSIGAMNQLADALENADWTNKDVNKLKQFKNLKGIKAVLDEKAEITFPKKKWFEVAGVIYLKVTSDGTTGKQWINRLKKQGFELSDFDEDMLSSASFHATTGIIYTIAVLKGDLFTDSNRITKEICSEAANRQLRMTSFEVSCLIRETFTDDDLESMGISWIITLHPNSSSLFQGYSITDDFSWYIPQYGYYNAPWNDNGGFAFEVSQVSLSA